MQAALKTNAVLSESKAKGSCRPLQRKAPEIRIAVSAKVLFDMQEKTSRTVFTKGAAFPMISKLMGFNKPGRPLVSLTVFSHSVNGTAPQVINSLEEYGLTEKANKSGRIITELFGHKASRVLARKKKKLSSFDLVLSASLGEAKTALSRGLPAVHIDPHYIPEDDGGRSIHIAGDFDRFYGLDVIEENGRLLPYDAENLIQKVIKRVGDKDKALPEMWARDKSLLHKPCYTGPLWPFLIKFNDIREIVNNDPELGDAKLSLVTARQFDARERVEITLDFWGIKRDNLKSTNWDAKGPVVANLGPHFYGDDSFRHVKSVRKCSPCTLVGQAPWNPAHISRMMRFYNTCSP